MLDFVRIAAETMRELRGSRSQAAFSRLLGYRSNVAYRWETGRRAPSAAEVFRIASKVGVEVDSRVAGFDRRTVSMPSMTHPDGVAALLRSVCASGRVADLSRRSGLSRHAIARALGGQSNPPLADVLCLVQGANDRGLDLLASIVDPRAIASARAEWHRLGASRRLAYESTFSEAFAAAVETRSYRAQSPPEEGWLAERLGVSVEEERETLRKMAEAGVLHRDGAHWVPHPDRNVDTRMDPRAFSHLREFWASEATRRMQASRADIVATGSTSRALPATGYLVFSASQSALQQISDEYLSFFDRARRIVSRSREPDRVALLLTQLCGLDGLPPL